MRKLAKHAKTRAVLDRLWALSAVRFGAERMRKFQENAKKRVFYATGCTGKDIYVSRQKACKKREKWRGKNRVPVVSLGENVDTSGFRDDGGVGVGWEIVRAGQRVEEGGVSRLLSLVFCLEGKETRRHVCKRGEATIARLRTEGSCGALWC